MINMSDYENEPSRMWSLSADAKILAGLTVLSVPSAVVVANEASDSPGVNYLEALIAAPVAVGLLTGYLVLKEYKELKRPGN